MATAHPNAADNALPRVDGEARPVSPAFSTVTIGTREGWGSDFSEGTSGIAAEYTPINPFSGVSTSHGHGEGRMYPDLNQIKNLATGARGREPTAPRPHQWFPESQDLSQMNWDPLANVGGQTTPQGEGRLPPRTPELNKISWPIPPRTTTTNARKMCKLAVNTTMFENFTPPGNRSFIVNPANRGLSNQRGLARAIEKGAGIQYANWCSQIVGTRTHGALEDGEVAACGSYLLRNKGYWGILNMAMQNVAEGTRHETQKKILMGYYDALFRTAYHMRLESLVMSLFGVGTWNYDQLTSVWCFLEVFQRLPEDSFKITLLIPDVKLANTVRRAQMEAWPRDRREGWGEHFEVPSPNPIVQELTSTLRDMVLCQNQTWPRLGEDGADRRGGGNATPEIQTQWTTWPPAGPGRQSQGQDAEAPGTRSHSPAPAQLTYMTPSTNPAPHVFSHLNPLEGPGWGDEEEGGLDPRVSSVHPSQDPIGAERGLRAPVPLYLGGNRQQSPTQELGESRSMPRLYRERIPQNQDRGFEPISTSRHREGPEGPGATSTPRHGVVDHPPNASPVPTHTSFSEVSNQSASRGTLSAGPRMADSSAHDTRPKIIVSDQDLGQDPSLGEGWSLLTFTNPSLMKKGLWESNITKRGGALYQDLRKTIMNTRNHIGLIPGKPLKSECLNIFPAVTKMVHMTLRKTTLEGRVLPESDKTKMIRNITSLLKDPTSYEGNGSPNQPYKLVINLKWGRYTVQGLRKVWMWEAIYAAISSLDDPGHTTICLMVDSSDLEEVRQSAQELEENDEDSDGRSGSHHSSGRSRQRNDTGSEPRSRGSDHNVQNRSLSSQSGTEHQDQSERGRSTMRRRAVQFDSSRSLSRSSPTRGILRHSSSLPDEEGESTETGSEEGSDWEAEYEGRRSHLSANRRRPQSPPRASSSSRSRSRSRSRDRPTYQRGPPPRAKNARAKRILLRPLEKGPPLRGREFRTNSGLNWNSGITNISDDSEGELAGDESGEMVHGYPVEWEEARALARSPSAERVLSQPGLAEPYKHAYLHAGYDLLRDQIIERDLALARVARGTTLGDHPLMRGNDPSSDYARQTSNLTSRLALPPLRNSTPRDIPQGALSYLSHYPSRDPANATGYSTGMEHNAHALLDKAKLVKALAPERTSGEDQASYLRRTAQIFEGTDLYHDPSAARFLGHTKGLEVPPGASLHTLVALDARTPGLDPGEKLVEELAPMVNDGTLALAVAAEKITQSVPSAKSSLLLEKLFTKIQGGLNLAVSCAQWTQMQLRVECIKYDQIKQLTLLKRSQGGQKGSGPPKQTQQKEASGKAPQKKSQNKPRKEARDSKNEKRGVSEGTATKEDPPKRPPKQANKGKPPGPKFLPAEEWAALPQEEKDLLRAQREAAKAAREAQD